MEDWRATSRVEIIGDLKDMMKDLLKPFCQATKHKHERIIFYQGGVSEGQFMEVRREGACHAARLPAAVSQRDVKAGLYFHRRPEATPHPVMPGTDHDGVGKCWNVPPGSTVDSVVTHPLDFDFFLCSHFGIQKLSYYLCLTYARCACSVSISTLAYCAHLAVYRAKNHIINKVDVSSSSSDLYGGSTNAVTNSQYVQAVKVVDYLQMVMYFV
ncbi:hypothetical protein HPB51_005587 [Rhipicephalus microplus]|uniref:Piwi domain-containing protein n=2 Tax=Rhipicephalus microplus TaxID=6941 RepID=A0A9J6EFF7_RHIMP|nr:hypothetical protein HPB51_005587 [Rhipicephalus microplus]